MAPAYITVLYPGNLVLKRDNSACNCFFGVGGSSLHVVVASIARRVEERFVKRAMWAGRPMSCVQEDFGFVNPHIVGSLTLPKLIIDG